MATAVSMGAMASGMLVVASKSSRSSFLELGVVTIKLPFQDVVMMRMLLITISMGRRSFSKSRKSTNLGRTS